MLGFAKCSSFVRRGKITSKINKFNAVFLHDCNQHPAVFVSVSEVSSVIGRSSLVHEKSAAYSASGSSTE